MKQVDKVALALHELKTKRLNEVADLINKNATNIELLEKYNSFDKMVKELEMQFLKEKIRLRREQNKNDKI